MDKVALILAAVGVALLIAACLWILLT